MPFDILNSCHYNFHYSFLPVGVVILWCCEIYIKFKNKKSDIFQHLTNKIVIYIYTLGKDMFIDCILNKTCLAYRSQRTNI